MISVVMSSSNLAKFLGEYRKYSPDCSVIEVVVHIVCLKCADMHILVRDLNSTVDNWELVDILHRSL
ncbi:unnamed protein product [Brugia timori]|uniref:Uncharacterized protein n=1 Tax=Brugia timori TaxID=42155 RepID=A0A0R3QGD2_9BILA|nr:unnamed protein product [Brugia timori]